MITHNAKIESTSLGREGHGFMTFYLTLDFSGSGQSTGGYVLGDYKSNKEKTTGYGMAVISKIIDVVGVESWEDLKGKYIRAIKEFDDWSAKVIGIQNITDDKKYVYWKDISEEWTKNA